MLFAFFSKRRFRICCPRKPLIYRTGTSFTEKKLKAPWFFCQQTYHAFARAKPFFFSSSFADCYHLRGRFPARTCRHTCIHLSYNTLSRVSYRPRGAASNGLFLFFFFYLRKAILQAARNSVARIKVREGVGLDEGANVKGTEDRWKVSVARREINAGIPESRIRVYWATLVLY